MNKRHESSVILLQWPLPHAGRGRRVTRQRRHRWIQPYIRRQRTGADIWPLSNQYASRNLQCYRNHTNVDEWDVRFKNNANVDDCDLHYRNKLPTTSGISAPTRVSSSSPLSFPPACTTPSTTIPIPTPTPTMTETSHPSTLSAVAKTGISVGSAFSGLAFIIAALLFYIARSRRIANIEQQDTNDFGQKQTDILQISFDVGLGPYYEIGGRVRPNELQGQARAELNGVPRVELDSTNA